MSAVFKFPANVEEFSINLDCDKSELLLVLACKDGTLPCTFAGMTKTRLGCSPPSPLLFTHRCIKMGSPSLNF